jgi:hypothetical protein
LSSTAASPGLVAGDGSDDWKEAAGVRHRKAEY